MKFSKNYTIDFGDGTFKLFNRTLSAETNEWNDFRFRFAAKLTRFCFFSSIRHISSDARLTAFFRKATPTKKSGTKDLSIPREYVEIWSNVTGAKESTIDLKTADKHGKFNVDG